MNNETERRNKAPKQRIKVTVKVGFWCAIVGALITALIALSLYKPESKTKITSTTLKSSLEQAGDLITSRYYYSDIGKFENSYEINGWSIPFTGKSFLLTYQGEATLGFKVSDMEVNIRGNRILVHCPAIEVLSNDIPSETVEVYDQTTNIFNPVTIDDYLAFETEQKQIAAQKMQTNGTFERAQQDAQRAIEQLLNMIPDIAQNYTIEVEFEQSQPISTADSVISEAAASSVSE